MENGQNYLLNKKEIADYTKQSNDFFELAPEYMAFVSMISFRQNNGNSIAFPYSLVQNIQFCPEKIELTFPDHLVIVGGICLQEIYDYLLLQRIILIQVKEEIGFNENGKLVVKSIEIKKIG